MAVALASSVGALWPLLCPRSRTPHARMPRYAQVFAALSRALAAPLRHGEGKLGV